MPQNYIYQAKLPYTHVMQWVSTLQACWGSEAPPTPRAAAIAIGIRGNMKEGELLGLLFTRHWCRLGLRTQSCARSLVSPPIIFSASAH